MATLGTPPTKCGFWWAKSGPHKWFNLIVVVRGEAPFLELRALDLGLDEGYKEIEPSNVAEWGPEIQNPNEGPAK
jgi:hypothetical protein